MNVGIVGHAADKFTPASEARARAIIRELLAPEDAILVSGGCHLGGVDVWAEEEARALGRRAIIYKPRTRSWSGGYKERNLQIADTADVVHCIVVAELPPRYKGLTHKVCYHCKTDKHVKSGGCWTAKRALHGVWHVV